MNVKRFNILKISTERCLHRSQLFAVGLSFIAITAVVLVYINYDGELQLDSVQVNAIQSPDTKTLDYDDEKEETNQKITSSTDQVNSKQGETNKETSHKIISPTEHVQVNSKQEEPYIETSHKITPLVEQVQVKLKQEKPKEEANQKMTPPTEHIQVKEEPNRETSQKIASPIEQVQVKPKQEKPKEEANQKMTPPTEHIQVKEEPNRETSQKVTSPIEQIQVKPKQEKPKEETSQVKLPNGPVNTKKPETKKQDDRGINATHINGILLEPVHASYTKNIYFTVKTTYKNYVGRLFPQMLTWYQVVDKNKVRH